MGVILNQGKCRLKVIAVLLPIILANLFLIGCTAQPESKTIPQQAKQPTDTDKEFTKVFVDALVEYKRAEIYTDVAAPENAKINEAKISLQNARIKLADAEVKLELTSLNETRKNDYKILFSLMKERFKSDELALLGLEHILEAYEITKQKKGNLTIKQYDDIWNYTNQSRNYFIESRNIAANSYNRAVKTKFNDPYLQREFNLILNSWKQNIGEGDKLISELDEALKKSTSVPDKAISMPDKWEFYNLSRELGNFTFFLANLTREGAITNREAGVVFCRRQTGEVFNTPAQWGTTFEVPITYNCPSDTEMIAMFHNHPSGVAAIYTSLSLGDKIGAIYSKTSVCMGYMTGYDYPPYVIRCWNFRSDKAEKLDKIYTKLTNNGTDAAEDEIIRSWDDITEVHFLR